MPQGKIIFERGGENGYFFIIIRNNNGVVLGFSPITMCNVSLLREHFDKYQSVKYLVDYNNDSNYIDIRDFDVIYDMNKDLPIYINIGDARFTCIYTDISSINGETPNNTSEALEMLLKLFIKL